MHDSTELLEDAGPLQKKRTQCEEFQHPIQTEENGVDEKDSNELTEQSENLENYHESSKSEQDDKTELEEKEDQAEQKERVIEIESQNSKDTLPSIKQRLSVKKQNFDRQADQEELSEQGPAEEAQKLIDEDSNLE